MKRTTILFLVMALGTMLSTSLKAQDLQVYSITGSAKSIKGKTSTQIAPRQILTMQTLVDLGDGAKLVLIDESAKKQYTLSAKGKYSIEKLISLSRNSTKSISEMYLAYLKKQISGKGVLTSQTAVDDTFASIERETNDSVFIVAPADTLIIPTDSISIQQ